ncbi:putative reverse transcriptase domain-containing protein [Tanacetum coccineum]
MPVELGSFEIIIGMDWLRKYHAVIVCDEKLVQIPYGNETLIFHGNKSNNGRESRLTIISCSKAQEYMAKGCQIFLAHISAKKEEDKSEGKQLEDVPIVRDFPEVFPEDLPCLPPVSTSGNSDRHNSRSRNPQLEHFTRRSSKEHLRKFLELLKKDKLYAKFSKCEFWIPNVQFLGHVIDSRGIHVDPTKIESIKDWASPKGEKEENAFQLIKQKLCSAPILALPEGSEDFVVYCDASHKGLGDCQGTETPIGLGLEMSISSCEGDSHLILKIISESLGTGYSMRCVSSRTEARVKRTIKLQGHVTNNRKDRLDQAENSSCSGLTKEATRICNVESRWSSKLGIGLCLKVSPWKGVVRFGKRVMSLEGIHVDDKLQFVEEPVEIIELEIKRLKRSRIPFVKVRWNSRRGPEFTWEREDSFKQKYPQLFTYRATSSTTRS